MSQNVIGGAVEMSAAASTPDLRKHIRAIENGNRLEWPTSGSGRSSSSAT